MYSMNVIVVFTPTKKRITVCNYKEHLWLWHVAKKISQVYLLQLCSRIFRIYKSSVEQKWNFTCAASLYQIKLELSWSDIESTRESLKITFLQKFQKHTCYSMITFPRDFPFQRKKKTLERRNYRFNAKDSREKILKLDLQLSRDFDIAVKISQRTPRSIIYNPAKGETEIFERKTDRGWKVIDGTGTVRFRSLRRAPVVLFRACISLGHFVKLTYTIRPEITSDNYRPYADEISTVPAPTGQIEMNDTSTYVRARSDRAFDLITPIA